MKNKIQIVSVLLVSIIIIPQIALASWWNPFSWNIFKNLFDKPQTNTTIIEQPKELIEENNIPIIEEKEENKDAISNDKIIDNIIKNKIDGPQAKTITINETIKTETQVTTEIKPNNEQNIFVVNAINAYEKELNIFNKAYETYINDYKNSFSKNGNISVSTDKTIWAKFNDSLSRLKTKWSIFKDEIYSSEENKDKRAEIMAKYPQPIISNYNKINEIHNSISTETSYYSLEKLSETKNYNDFFATYGVTYNLYFSNEMKSGLSTALSNKYTSKVDCLKLSGRYEILGCETYIKVVDYENKINNLKTLLES